ncbi:hypothetical protein FIU97_04825 [Roseivivax sp. THAF40]|uniref:hypothetical protein n=1 Tax=unclassified Roseivivax TaxID=2639302 RepID=UPI0012691F5B|nr:MULTISPECIES: hypothetical protein [unclassified Roseivivax]QFS82095.1 hypothetical protein FIV09_04565 [Roseivivax sp. THAF197b]QFT45895.1 hypothetical protein FIU97_04825 [Roseivivax sp. THAF40]
MTRSEMLERYEAKKVLLERSHQVEAGQASALAYAAFATKNVFDENPLLQKAAHAAMLFNIAAIGIVPILLIFYLN